MTSPLAINELFISWDSVGMPSPWWSRHQSLPLPPPTAAEKTTAPNFVEVSAWIHFLWIWIFKKQGFPIPLNDSCVKNLVLSNICHKIFMEDWETNAKTVTIINSLGNFIEVFSSLCMYIYKTSIVLCKSRVWVNLPFAQKQWAFQLSLSWHFLPIFPHLFSSFFVHTEY